MLMNTPKQRRGNQLLIEAGIVVAIALILILIVPWVLTDFRLNLLGRFLALSIAGLGIDLIWGYTGLLSLGHGVFFALGGYLLAMYLKLQIPETASNRLPEFMNLYGVTELPWFWQPFHNFGFTMVAILFLPTIIGGLLGYLVFRNRIRGVYFSILTQAATIVFFNFFNGQQKLFNGTNGLTDFKTILGADIGTYQYTFYILTIAFLVLAYALCRWLTSGSFGNLLVAIRDDENRLRFSGYNPTGFKVIVFAVSAALAGIGGAFYTIQTGRVSPQLMDIGFSIEMVIWVAAGGRATLVGAILGTLLVNFAKSLLSEQFPDVWLFFQGALFLLVVTVLPEGIIGLKKLFQRKKSIDTYPDIDLDPDVQSEREHLSN
ncbi:urea ABC transporter permease subunit UrtC [Chamaesiphon polymorphus]|uniref:Urea ABC transporter permease subunit UrtC n=1 Tax=Chamaesiphon polymorphus CCALA 037 TaxID=2107692 RepID=A0A2T1GBF3_9CYAN|nr:urea ABC transporter permease subunit UrtC [Chamaesiphon polymorphus]PSB54653.1 urea ABC transporter permease subunit UrtC [Chamaesiphon polymorphus CCALA 037]